MRRHVIEVESLEGQVLYVFSELNQYSISCTIFIERDGIKCFKKKINCIARDEYHEQEIENCLKNGKQDNISYSFKKAVEKSDEFVFIIFQKDDEVLLRAVMVEISSKSNLKSFYRHSKDFLTYKNEVLETQKVMQSVDQELQKTFKIMIEYGDKLFAVDTDENSLVSQLEVELKEKFNLEQKIRLLSSGKLLESNMSFREQNIIEGTSLKMQVNEESNLPDDSSQLTPQIIQHSAQVIPIFFKFNEQLQSLEISYDTKLSELMQFLSSEGLITGQQNFMKNGQILPQDQTVQELKIQKGDILEASQQEIELKIHYMDDEIQCSVNSNYLISEFIDCFKECHDLKESFEFLVDGKTLNPNNTFEQENVTSGCILILVETSDNIF